MATVTVCSGGSLVLPLETVTWPGGSLVLALETVTWLEIGLEIG